MRDYVREDDQQRAVHLLVRTHISGSGLGSPSDHLDGDELAGMISGTLLKTECCRVENHLLSCDSCRQSARFLHKDHEAGVMPILLRRATAGSDPGERLHQALTRQYTPWIIGILVFAFFIILPLSIERYLTSGEHVCEERYMVISRVGTPVIKDPEGNRHMPAETGSWLVAGDILLMETGDVLELLGDDGGVMRMTTAGIEQQASSSGVLAGLFDGAWKDRVRVERIALRDVVDIDEGGGLRILHPRKKVYSQRPNLRWVGDSVRRSYRVKIAEYGEDSERPVFERVVQGGRLRYPQSALSLERGRIYDITITPLTMVGRPQDDDPTGKVRVAGNEDAQKFADDLAILDPLLGRGHNLLRAFSYMRHQLWSEAKEELEACRL